MSYRLVVAARAEAYRRRLDRPAQARISKRFGELAEDPYESRFSKPLVAGGGQRSSRIGGWRIIFEVDDETRTVEVTRIAPRGQVYR